MKFIISNQLNSLIYILLLYIYICFQKKHSDIGRWVGSLRLLPMPSFFLISNIYIVINIFMTIKNDIIDSSSYIIFFAYYWLASVE